MAPNRRRGRPRSNRPQRNTCIHCRVFISNKVTVCGQCSRQEHSNEVDSPAIQQNDAILHASGSVEEASEQPDVNDVQIPIENQSTNIELCSLCGLHERSVESLCSFCRPADLSNYSSDECEKCRRKVPLNDVPVSEVKSTAFGCPHPRDQSEVKLCNECSHYAVNGIKSSWSKVWPSALLDFRFGKYSGHRQENRSTR